LKNAAIKDPSFLKQPGSFKKRGYVILIRQPAEKDLVQIKTSCKSSPGSSFLTSYTRG